MRTIALDVHKEKIVLCEVSKGKVVVRASGRRLDDLKNHIGPDTPGAKIAFEACRSAWFLHDCLEKWGHVPIILDTTRIRMIGVGQHRRKNDEIDAEAMARALEKGYVFAAHVLSPQRREVRRLLAIRFGFVSARTQYINIVRGLATSDGVDIASCDADDFVQHAREATWGSATRRQIDSTIAMIEQLTRSLHESTKMLHAVCSADPVIALLATAPFIGLIGASTIVSVIDDAHRFRDAHAVASYLGLVPSENTSNSSPRLGSITKAGNVWARVALVEAAWGILNKGDPADPLVAWGRMVAGRRNKCIAAVAIARRLAGILWAMWKYDRPYDPKHLATASSRGLCKQAKRVEADAELIAELAANDSHRAKKLKAAQDKLRGAFTARLTTSSPKRAAPAARGDATK